MNREKPTRQAVELRGVIARLLQVFKVEEALSPDGPHARMNLPDLNVVLFLGEAGVPVTMGAIAAFLNARLSTAGTIVERLVRGRLARRERVEEDRRIVLVSLTPEGVALQREVVAVQTGHCQAMLDALDTDDERQAMLAILAKVAGVAQATGSARDGA